VNIEGKEMTLIALPVIFQQFQEAGKAPGNDVLGELMEVVKIYNPIPNGEEAAYSTAIQREYSAYYERMMDTQPEGAK
jgi:hypothetical protein